MSTEIIRKAKEYTSGDGIEVGVLPYGDDLVHDGPPYGSHSNLVTYDFTIVDSGDYALYVEYAAAVSRPCGIRWNRRPVLTGNLGSVTGFFEEGGQKWERQGVVSAPAGVHTLEIHRAGPFPHLRTIKLVKL